MLYYVAERKTEKGIQMTAGVKARDDLEAIFEKYGAKKLIINLDQENRKNSSSLKKIQDHNSVKNIWKEKLKDIQSGDSIIIQFPVINHTLFMGNVIKNLHKRGVKIILFIHDLDMLRISKRSDISLKSKVRINFEEKSILSLADYIVAHNKKMIKQLVDDGIEKNKLFDLEIFDYLIPNYENNNKISSKKDDPIIIAGALLKHKSGYIYSLPNQSNFNLFGIGYENENKSNIEYFGAFPPDDLPFSMKGSFGLVWDGPTSNTCEGPYGEYLKINNPHKTSLYLASGFPVIIWEQAALADFILKNRCGLVVDNLNHLSDKLANLSVEEYNDMRSNALKISKNLRHGFYTTKVLGQIESA